MGLKKDAAKGATSVIVNGVKYFAEHEAAVATRALPQWVCQVGSGIKSTGKYLWKNPKSTLLYGGIGIGSLTGQGAINTWKNMFLPKGEDGEGLGQTINRAVNGEDLASKHNLLGATTDNILGEGTSDQIAQSLKDAKDGIQHGYEATRDQIANMGKQIREKFDGQPEHHPAGQYPTSLTEEQIAQLQMQEYLHYAGYPLNQQADSGQLGGQFRQKGGFFDQASDFISNLFGNKNATMGTTAVAAAAWLLFGRFGWLAKVGGVLGGYWGLGKLRDGLGDSYSQMMAARRGNMVVERGGVRYEVPRTAGQNYDQMYEMDRQQSQQKIVDRSNPNLSMI